MKWIHSLFSLFLLVIVFLSTMRLSAQNYDFSAVDKLLQDSLSVLAGEGLQSGGGCALILMQNGKTIYKKSFALPNRTYATDRVVLIASATKWYSAAVIMSLIDEGKLSLNDTTGKFLPNYAALKDGKARMTIRQLFSHTSGLSGLDDASCLGDNAITLANCVEQISTVTLKATPGAQFSYGGNSMQVAGRIAELASGLQFASGSAWDTLFVQRITRPLGMNSTRYDGVLTVDSKNPQIGGSARSTGDDYAKFLAMLMNKGLAPDGKRILSEQAINDMLADQTRGAQIVYSPFAQYGFLTPELSKTRYGIGNWCEVVDATTGKTVESNSIGKFGFSPWIDRSRNLVGVLSIFSDNSKTFPTYWKLKQLLRQIIPVIATDVHSDAESENAIRTSPNPASDILRIEGAEGVSGLKLLNVLGQIVLTKSEVQLPATVDVSSLPSGLYILHIQKNHHYFYQTLLVQR